MKTAFVLVVALAAAAADPLPELQPRQDSEVPPIQPRTTLDCGRHRLDPGTYIIESPNHPDPYPNSYRCKYVIMARDRSEVQLTCSAFDLEDHRRCRYDFLKIGRTKYCGTDMPPAVSATKLKVLFKTDVDTVSTGFRCEVVVGGDSTTAATAATTAATAATTAATAATTAATAATTAATAATTTAPPSGSCCCGTPNRSSRIVGGMDTDQYEYPWQVGLVTSGTDNPWCGGTIINSLYILTAAHCTAGETTRSMEVLIKEHRINANDGQIRRSIANINDHPSYTSASGSGYDVSLLKLSEVIAFPSDNTIAPACLPTAGNDFVGADAVVTGWGHTTSGGSGATTLQEVTVPVISNDDCRNSYSQINPSMICAGLSQGGKDSCQGDSGGPMVSLENDRYAVIGVVSWGRGCALPGYPGVYARVTQVLSWITDNTADGQFCQ